MTVQLEEIRALIPASAEIIEFNPTFRYLIIVKSNAVSGQSVFDLSRGLTKLGIAFSLILVHGSVDDPIRVQELVP
jgi:hypothetical protein